MSSHFLSIHEGIPGDGVCVLFDSPGKKLRLYGILMMTWNLKETLNLTTTKMKTNHKAETYSSSLIDELLKGISPEEQERTDKRMLLAARIDDGIKAKGWKKKDFAMAMSKTPSEITKWLSGTHNFTADTLFDIERVLEINLFQKEVKQLPEVNQV